MNLDMNMTSRTILQIIWMIAFIKGDINIIKVSKVQIKTTKRLHFRFSFSIFTTMQLPMTSLDNSWDVVLLLAGTCRDKLAIGQTKVSTVALVFYTLRLKKASNVLWNYAMYHLMVGQLWFVCSPLNTRNVCTRMCSATTSAI